MSVRLATLLALLAFALPGQVPVPERGDASWYGAEWQGRAAASGELYDAASLTAAHRTLAFGTRVRVRRLDNRRAVIVRVNDRGPYADDRIIDVSEAAAYRLGMTSPGVVAVEVEVLGGAPAAAGYTVQVGTFRIPDNARRTQELMEREFGGARIAPGGRGMSCVQVGEWRQRAAAEVQARSIRSRFPALAGALTVPVTGLATGSAAAE